MQKCYLLLIFLASGIFLTGQEIGLADIPVTIEGKQLTLPFAGGLTAPQFSTVDMNVDGVEDLFIYEREGRIIIPLINNSDGTWTYDPSYREIFPKIPTWGLLRDYNKDGIKDIFCGPVNVGIAGVEVYKGVVTDGALSYELVRFPEDDFDLLHFPIGNIRSQIYVSVIDIPDIRDIDGDGDLDVVAFEPSGTTIYYYKNEAIERGFTVDTLIYSLHEGCYGGMIESGFSQEVTLSPDPGTCASSLWEGEDILADTRHSGSTVFSLDVTGDELQEVILGDISYDGLVMLTNSGTLEEAHFTEQNVRFPAGTEAADIELFLSIFSEDIDGNDAPELIVCPNDRFAGQSTNHIWTYDVDKSNEGEVVFSLIKKNFLVEDMVYHGTNTSPMFFDYNGDKLVDLLVGSTGLSPDGLDVNPGLSLYENVGSASSPAYELVDDDYLGMSAFKTTSRRFNPTVGDLDGDGDIDMILGDNRGRLYYLENESGTKDVLQFKTPVYEAFDIKMSAEATPFIYDYNRDGLGDLIIGEQNFNSEGGQRGSLNYFQNVGSVGQAQFISDEATAPNDPLFGRVNLREPGFINNYSAPVVVDIGEDLLIASGTAQGFMYLYTTDELNPADSFDVRSVQYAALREGEQSVMSFADLNGDQYLEVAIGTRRGGVAIYHTDIFADLPSPTTDMILIDELTLSPNPVSDILRIELANDTRSPNHMIIYSADGRVVHNQSYEKPLVDVSSLKDGVYLIELRGKEVSYTGRFVKVDSM